MLIIAKKEISESILYEAIQINLNLNLDSLVSLYLIYRIKVVSIAKACEVQIETNLYFILGSQIYTSR